MAIEVNYRQIQRLPLIKLSVSVLVIEAKVSFKLSEPFQPRLEMFVYIVYITVLGLCFCDHLYTLLASKLQ